MTVLPFSRLLTYCLALGAITSSASPIGPSKRSLGIPSLVGNPAVIDPDGVYIRATRLGDSDLIAGYAAADGTQRVLRVAKSADNGASWTHLGEVYRADSAAHDIDNAFPLQLPDSRILYAYRNHDRNSTDGQYTYHRITISYSVDGGATYNYLSTVDERAASGANGLWEPFMRVSSNGSIQCYYSSENSANDQNGLMRVSADGGLTWGDRITVSGAGLVSRSGMMGIASTDMDGHLVAGVISRDGLIGVDRIDDNGNLIAVFQSNEDPKGFTVDAVTSSDDGMTWGGRFRLYSGKGKGQAGIPQVSNVGGTLVVSFMTNEDHDIGKGLDGGDLKIITSLDGARSWSDPFTVGSSPAHWPGLFSIDQTHFLALYSHDGQGAVAQAVELS